ncbi:MAG: DUF6455 family protein [Paracoccaceae bacterium]
MRPLGEMRTHYWLAQRMAGRHALDLSEAAARGDLDQETWAGVVQRCRGCGWTEGCERFLARGDLAPDPRESWPETCPNRTLFASLKVMEKLEEYQ